MNTFASLFAMILDATLKATVLLVLAWVAGLALKNRSAALRHTVRACALCAILLLPVLASLLPAWHWKVLSQVSLRPVSAASSTESATTAAAVVPAFSSHSVEPATPEPIANLEQPLLLHRSAAAPVSRPKSAMNWPQALLVVWLLGMMLGMVRLLMSRSRFALLVRKAAPLDDPSWGVQIRSKAHRLGIRRSVALLESKDTEVPLTSGALHPKVILSPDYQEWSAVRRDAVLHHELAHIKRLDTLSQALSQIASAVYWFHPLVWLTARTMRAEREQACDDYVLASGAKASEYAHELLEIASSLRQPEFTAALAMARRSQLEGRVMALLNPALRRGSVSRSTTLAIAVLTLCAVLPLAALQSTASQNRSSKQPASPAPAPAPVAPTATPDAEQPVTPPESIEPKASPEVTMPPELPTSQVAPAPPSGGVVAPHMPTPPIGGVRDVPPMPDAPQTTPIPQAAPMPPAIPMPQAAPAAPVTPRPEHMENVTKTFYLHHVSAPADLENLVNALRKILEPQSIYLIRSKNAIVVRGHPDQIALAWKIIDDVDRKPPAGGMQNLPVAPPAPRSSLMSSKAAPATALVASTPNELAALRMQPAAVTAQAGSTPHAVDELQAQVATLAAATPQAANSISPRIAELRGQLAALAEQADSTPDAVAALRAQLAAAEAEAPRAAASTSTRVAKLHAQLAAANAQTASTSHAVAALRTKIAAMPSHAAIAAVAPQTATAAGGCVGSPSHNHNMEINNDGRHRRLIASWSGQDCHVDLHAEEEITFNEDTAWIESISKGGFFEVNERRGNTVRQVRVTPSSGSLQFVLKVNGVEQPFDSNAREWFSSFLNTMERTTWQLAFPEPGSTPKLP
jgi:beta-lactamase regulating signal transducer with metallopeptidase domain